MGFEGYQADTGDELAHLRGVALETLREMMESGTGAERVAAAKAVLQEERHSRVLREAGKFTFEDMARAMAEVGEGEGGSGDG